MRNLNTYCRGFFVEISDRFEIERLCSSCVGSISWSVVQGES